MSKGLLFFVVLSLSAGTVLTGCSNKPVSSATDANASQPPGATPQQQIDQIQHDRSIPSQAKDAMIQKIKSGGGSAKH